MLCVNISKMFRLSHIFGLFILISVNGAPSPSDKSSSVTKLEQIAKVNTADARIDIPITLDEATNNENNDAQGQRQKRYYNYYGYGFPPMNPVIYPSFPNNDPYSNNFQDDSLQQIHRRLQDIASAVRTPNFNQPPPPPLFPFLFPVLFIPQIGCGCSPSQGNMPKPNQNGTVDVTNRFPDMEDTNQNWGIVVNQNETEEDDGMPEDFTRPISFQPIRPSRPMNRPPPVVDHGSVHEGRDMTTTTTAVPPAAPVSSENAPLLPTACDTAILICCHQSQVTYECFAAQGCPDTSPWGGNPCQPQSILQVINRFSRYYGQRIG